MIFDTEIVSLASNRENVTQPRFESMSVACLDNTSLDNTHVALKIFARLHDLMHHLDLPVTGRPTFGNQSFRWHLLEKSLTLRRSPQGELSEFCNIEAQNIGDNSVAGYIYRSLVSHGLAPTEPADTILQVGGTYTEFVVERSLVRISRTNYGKRGKQGNMLVVSTLPDFALMMRKGPTLETIEVKCVEQRWNRYSRKHRNCLVSRFRTAVAALWKAMSGKIVQRIGRHGRGTSSTLIQKSISVCDPVYFS
jgi:hypothetical protein